MGWLARLQYNNLARGELLSGSGAVDLVRKIDQVCVLQGGEDCSHALVFMNVSKYGTALWVVTAEGMEAYASGIAVDEVNQYVKALRCGLDEEEWDGVQQQRFCIQAVGLPEELPDSAKPLPFDIGKAHELYDRLVGPLENDIKGKHLIIVPSGALAKLPFQVLVTKPPKTAIPQDFSAYRDVPWLVRSHAITVLPSVASLKSLSEHAAQGKRAPLSYLGFGNPVLSGDGQTCRSGRLLDQCPDNKARFAFATTQRSVKRSTVKRDNVSPSLTRQVLSTKDLLADVSGLCPLPDTELEVKCIARRFKDSGGEIRLGRSATKAEVRRLNDLGELSRYRIIHFATHGLLAGNLDGG